MIYKQTNNDSGYFKNLNIFIERISSAPIALTLFTALMVVLGSVNLFDFPLSVPYMLRISGQTYLDMQLFISSDKVYELLNAFGTEGRKTQLMLLSTIDILIPTLSATAGVAMISFLFRDQSGQLVVLGKLRLVAFLAGFTDFMENAGIFILVTLYPERLDTLASATSVITGIKSIFYLMTFTLMILGVVYRIYSRLIINKDRVR